MGAGGGKVNCVLGCPIRQRDRHNKDEEKGQQLEVNSDYSNSPTSVQKDSMIIQLNKSPHQHDRLYDSNGISPTLDSMQGGNRQPFIGCELRTDEGISRPRVLGNSKTRSTWLPYWYG
jgi:hypothetical protein